MNSVIAAILSPLAVLRIGVRTWALLIAYLMASAIVLFAVRELLLRFEDDLLALVLDYLFPESWHFAAELVIEQFFARQEREVVINLVIATALMVVTVSLFWLKELVSASFERGARLTATPIEEHPLAEQAWQEIKLVLLFLAVQGTIFWIGYQPSWIWKKVAVALSYLFLFFTYAIDFASPIFQRHLGHYSRILKTLARNGVGSVLFGAMFALPTIVVGRVWQASPEWSWQEALAVLFSVNVLTVSWACVAGTWYGSRMMTDFESSKRSSFVMRGTAWLITLTLLAGNAYAFGAVGLSVHHKSQILKCKYDLEWSSFGFERPDLLDLLSDRVDVGFYFDVEIENPTSFDIDIEKNRLEVRHRGDVVATTSIAPLAVPSQETRTQRVEFTLGLTPSMLRKGRELLDRDAWKMVLYVEVAKGFEFPIYLLGYDVEGR